MIKNVLLKLFLIIILSIAIFYYNITIPLINGIIQLKINILGFFLEPLLQWAFDVSLRQAQVISAWIYLFLAVSLTGYLFIRLSRCIFANIYNAYQFWLSLSKWQQSGIILFMSLFFIATIKIALLIV